jgi:hypothetical protein
MTLIFLLLLSSGCFELASLIRLERRLTVPYTWKQWAWMIIYVTERTFQACVHVITSCTLRMAWEMNVCMWRFNFFCKQHLYIYIYYMYTFLGSWGFRSTPDLDAGPLVALSPALGAGCCPNMCVLTAHGISPFPDAIVVIKESTLNTNEI